MSDYSTLLSYIVKLEATYLKLKQKQIREKNMFKAVLLNLQQNLGVKGNEHYFEQLVIQDDDPLTKWTGLFNKADNVIRIKKEIMKKEPSQMKQKRKRRTKEEMNQQVIPQ